MRRKADTKRAALYMRVSTSDQHPENQRAPLERLCAAAGYTIAPRHRFVDKESGGKSDRPEFQRLMKAAGAGELDVIVCWSIDRFTREGIVPTFQYLEKLHRNGVGFVSHQEPFLSTVGAAGPTGISGPDVQSLVLAVISWVAEWERTRKRERIVAGLARARAAGRRLGKRPVDWKPKEVADIQARHKAGESLRKLGEAFGHGKDTIRKIIEAGKAKPRRKSKNG